MTMTLATPFTNQIWQIFNHKDEFIFKINSRNIKEIDSLSWIKDQQFSSIFDIDNIELYSDIELNIFKALGVSLRLNQYSPKKQARLRELDIPYFFKFIATSAAEVRKFISEGASQVYIGGDLGFNLPSLTSLHLQKIGVRAFANNAFGETLQNAFFIRPEDAAAYSRFIDVIELDNSGGVLNAATLYKIYRIDQKWDGRLREIILNLDSDIHNRVIDKNIFEKRIGCGNCCFWRENSCSICRQFEELDKALTNTFQSFSENKEEQ